MEEVCIILSLTVSMSKESMMKSSTLPLVRMMILLMSQLYDHYYWVDSSRPPLKSWLQRNYTRHETLHSHPTPYSARKEKENQGSWHKYQPSGAGGTRSPPATPHCLQYLRWPLGGPKMADGVWKGFWMLPSTFAK